MAVHLTLFLCAGHGRVLHRPAVQNGGNVSWNQDDGQGSLLRNSQQQCGLTRLQTRVEKLGGVLHRPVSGQFNKLHVCETIVNHKK